MEKDDVVVLSDNEAVLFMAVAAIVQSIPRGPQRKMLAGLLEAHRAKMLEDRKPEPAALLGLLASYAETGPG